MRKSKTLPAAALLLSLAACGTTEPAAIENEAAAVEANSLEAQNLTDPDGPNAVVDNGTVDPAPPSEAVPPPDAVSHPDGYLPNAADVPPPGNSAQTGTPPPAGD